MKKHLIIFASFFIPFSLNAGLDCPQELRKVIATNPIEQTLAWMWEGLDQKQRDALIARLIPDVQKRAGLKGLPDKKLFRQLSFACQPVAVGDVTKHLNEWSDQFKKHCVSAWGEHSKFLLDLVKQLDLHAQEWKNLFHYYYRELGVGFSYDLRGAAAGSGNVEMFNLVWGLEPNTWAPRYWDSVLRGAAESGNIAMFALVLGKMPAGADICWNSALEAAARSGNVAMFALVLGKMPAGADICWNSVLEAAARSGNVALFELVLGKLAGTRIGWWVLRGAARSGNIAMFALVLGKLAGTHINWDSVLYCAAGSGNANMFALALGKVPAGTRIDWHWVLRGAVGSEGLEVAKHLIAIHPNGLAVVNPKDADVLRKVMRKEFALYETYLLLHNVWPNVVGQKEKKPKAGPLACLPGDVVGVIMSFVTGKPGVEKELSWRRVAGEKDTFGALAKAVDGIRFSRTLKQLESSLRLRKEES